jgi:hypothetical protein
MMTLKSIPDVSWFEKLVLLQVLIGKFSKRTYRLSKKCVVKMKSHGSQARHIGQWSAMGRRNSLPVRE